jgi:hypothetical protein
MSNFWLATFDAKLPPNATPSSSRPLAVSGVRKWAVEIIENGDEYAVLFATIDNDQKLPNLVCRIGFANGSGFCNRWRDRGFPLIESAITRDGDKVEIVSAFNPHPPRGHDEPRSGMIYHKVLVEITGVVTGDVEHETEHPGPYQQTLQVPDSVFPAQQLAIKPVTWKPQRGDVKGAGQHRVKVRRARFPDLSPFSEEPMESIMVWFGTSELPDWPTNPGNAPIRRTSRAKVFGSSSFRFDDVEILGFRVDLSEHCREVDEELTKLIEPLNFHRTPQRNISLSTTKAVSDFEYRHGTCTLMVELLRYGKMRPSEPAPPLTQEDYESQHELLTRILVGRVDDDTAQARDAATFVPAIFVDNAWSKALGRDCLGYDKRMAMFCVVDGGKPYRLQPDGRLSPKHKRPEPLGSVAEIHLSTTTGKDPTPETILLKLDCPYKELDDWGAFDDIDLNVAWGAFPLAPIRWQQRDFDKPEFRRSFARSVTTTALKGFDSIQASPIGEPRLQLELPEQMTWINSQFTIDNGAQVARPTGIVELTLYANQEAPEAWWQTLCKMLRIAPGKSRTISLPSGSWYRMRCSMDLTIDDGL